jgi:oligoendopeptidase F
MPQKPTIRSEVATEHTWNTESVFASNEAWESAISRLQSNLSGMPRFKGHLNTSPEILAEFLDTAERIGLEAHKIYLYASMFHDVDTADQDAMAMYDRALGIYAQALTAISFGEPEILAIDRAQLQQWCREQPHLGAYEHYFDQLNRRRAHVRSSEVEALLSQLAAPFTSASGIHGTLADADLRFAPASTSSGDAITIAQGNIGALLTNPDREIRRTAWEHYADAHLAVKNTIARCLATGVKQQVFMARARNYASALEAAVSANNIPVQVFHTLIATYRKHLPIWHRYWRVRRQALGYDKLHVYDVKAPLVAVKRPVPFEQAMQWITDGMAPLGEEYVETMRRGVANERWVDFAPNQGKRAGAYSSGVKGTHPFILMSYTDDIFSMSTLAHELGHSMHSYYTWQTQPDVYANYTIFAAEVASNFNQALVRAHLLQTDSDPDFQIEVIEEAMSNFHRYFFIMPTLARFELEIHQRVERGEALTADSMNTLMTELFREGYGSEVEVDAERVGSTWMQFPTHMYLNFYVYQYATGISAAHALADRILAQESGAVERYIAFLKAGSSKYPLEALTDAGVTMTSAEPVERAFAVLERMVERLEQLVAQRAH